MLLLEDLVRSDFMLLILMILLIVCICNYLILHLFYTFRGTGGKLLCSIRILPEIKRHVTALDLYLTHRLNAVVFKQRMQ